MKLNMKNRKRILFYVERNLHLPFLEPVHDYIQEHYHEVEASFSAPPYQPAIDGKTGYGIDDETVQRLSEKSRFIHDIVRYKPHITVVADIGAAYGLKDCGSIVNLGHGLTSKGCFYTHRPIVRRENLADLICVPGPLHKKTLEKNVFVPIIPTGFITADRIFDTPDKSRSKFCEQYNIDQNKKIILFAPTFNDELSAIPVVREQIFNIAGSKNHLIIKLHGMTDKKWVDLYKNKADQNPHATYIKEHSLTPCLMAADLLISDVSSAYVEFLLLDKPVILINNPRKKKFIMYDPDDIEYKLRDACTIVENVRDLEREIDRNLLNPEKFSRKRKLYAKAICFGQDGKAAQRAAQAIHNHFSSPFSTRFSILVFWDHTPSASELLNFWERLKYSTKGYQIEVIMAGPKPKTQTLTSFCKHWIECPVPDSRTLDKAVELTENEYIAFIHPGVDLIQGWLKHFFCHFQWNTDIGLVQALTPDNGYNLVLQQFFPEHKNLTFPEISFLFNRFLIGSSIKSDTVDSTSFMIKKTDYDYISPSSKVKKLDERIKDLEQDLKKRKKDILKCIDLFAYPVS